MNRVLSGIHTIQPNPIMEIPCSMIPVKSTSLLPILLNFMPTKNEVKTKVNEKHAMTRPTSVELSPFFFSAISG